MIRNLNKIKGKKLKNMKRSLGNGLELVFEDGTIADVLVMYYPDGTTREIIINNVSGGATEDE